MEVDLRVLLRERFLPAAEVPFFFFRFFSGPVFAAGAWFVFFLAVVFFDRAVFAFFLAVVFFAGACFVFFFAACPFAALLFAALFRAGTLLAPAAFFVVFFLRFALVAVFFAGVALPTALREDLFLAPDFVAAEDFLPEARDALALTRFRLDAFFFVVFFCRGLSEDDDFANFFFRFLAFDAPFRAVLRFVAGPPEVVELRFDFVFFRAGAEDFPFFRAVFAPFFRVALRFDIDFPHSPGQTGPLRASLSRPSVHKVNTPTRPGLPAAGPRDRLTVPWD